MSYLSNGDYVYVIDADVRPCDSVIFYASIVDARVGVSLCVVEVESEHPRYAMGSYKMVSKADVFGEQNMCIQVLGERTWQEQGCPMT